MLPYQDARVMIQAMFVALLLLLVINKMKEFGCPNGSWSTVA